MQRVIVGVGALLLFSSLIQSPAMEQKANAQDTSAQATIEALQTRVAILEEQLDITPTPVATVSTTATSERRTQSTIAGTALANLPAGKTHSLELIVVGEYRGYIPLVVRNNSKETLDWITVSVTVRSPDGTLLASGDNENVTHPGRVGPGEVAFSDIPMNNTMLPDDAVYQFSLESRPAEPIGESYLIDLDIVEASKIFGRIVGEVQNTSGLPVERSQMSGMCFDFDGLPSAQLLEGLNPATLSPNGTSTFQSDSQTIAQECSTFLVAARGARE